MKRIAIILPYRADFSPLRAGAIELCVEETSTVSKYAQDIVVYGQEIDDPFASVEYCGVKLGLDRVRGRTIGMARRLIKLWRSNLPELIEVHNRANLFLALKRALPSARVTLHFHNDPQTIRGAKTVAEREVLTELADAIVCVSSFVKERFVEGVSSETDHVHVVENGVPRFSDVMPSKDKLILFANRLIEAKGTVPFARAVASLLPSYPEWRVLFVGRGDDEVRREVKAILDPLGERAEVLPAVPYQEILTLNARAAIIAVPVLWDEPFGRTAAEALAAGAALLATPNGGLRDILKRAGVEVAPNEADMVRGLERLLSDPDFLTDQQKRSFERFDFTVEASSAKLDAVRCQFLD